MLFMHLILTPLGTLSWHFLSPWTYRNGAPHLLKNWQKNGHEDQHQRYKGTMQLWWQRQSPGSTSISSLRFWCDFSAKNRLLDPVLGARSTLRLSAVMWRVDSSRHPKLGAIPWRRVSRRVNVVKARQQSGKAARHFCQDFREVWTPRKLRETQKRHRHGLSWVSFASLESFGTFAPPQPGFANTEGVGINSVAGWVYNQPNECAKRKLVWQHDNKTAMNLRSERDAIRTAAVWEDASDARSSLLRML